MQESDRSSAGSPEPAAGSLHEHQLMMEDLKNSRKRRRSPSPENLHQAKRAAVAQAHLNGTSKCRGGFFADSKTQNAVDTFSYDTDDCLLTAVARIVAGMALQNLQNLQNLANLQNLPQVASLAAGLQGMTAGLTNNQLINTPLNLTVSSSGE